MFKLAPGQRTVPEQGAPIGKESERVNRWEGAKFAASPEPQIAVSDRIQSRYSSEPPAIVIISNSGSS
jgi:hypothetical protein